DLVDLGFTRILTSGGADTALEGAEKIRKIRERAGSDIEVLLCGGIRPGAIRQTLEATGADQIHLAPMKKIGVAPGLFGQGYNVLDEAILSDAVREAKPAFAAG
ncbi:MAG TPA: copper homeostasis protein CutC, partial [Fimbriimonadaceae bacterium]|nr:copper homeostasis protein CutC [Fimbriimonadaceae bacterium]